VTRSLLELARDQILAYRRTVGALDERLPPGPDSLRRAAWAGLQDSMPRAAVLSIHARVQGTGPDSWADPSLAQVWGPRFSAYVVAARDVPAFTLGRRSDDPGRRRMAEDLAARLEAFLAGRRMPYGEAGRGLGVHPNQLRYAATTGTVRIRWEGARQPIVWTVPPPDVEPSAARVVLTRRYLHVFGPTTAAGFARWAGLRPPGGRAAFEALASSLTPVRTPVGAGWILAEDEAAFREPTRPVAPARLLPSGDPFYLLQGPDRELLVTDAVHRDQLWTPRVWPGAVVVEGEIVGTWRRTGADVSIAAWRRLSPAARAAVETEASGLPLASVERGMRVRWAG
jgi:hypothetical protein